MNAKQDGEIVKTAFYLPIDLDTDVRVEAARNRTSISAIAIEAFEFYLAHKQKAAPVKKGAA